MREKRFVDSNRIESNRIELNQIKSNRIELNQIKSNRIEFQFLTYAIVNSVRDLVCHLRLRRGLSCKSVKRCAPLPSQFVTHAIVISSFDMGYSINVTVCDVGSPRNVRGMKPSS